MNFQILAFGNIHCPNLKLCSDVNRFIEQLKVQEHANKRSKKLSGGTKRKVTLLRKDSLVVKTLFSGHSSSFGTYQVAIIKS